MYSLRESDVKVEQYERQIQQLTQKLDEKDRINEELEIKNKELKEQLEEFNTMLESMWSNKLFFPVIFRVAVVMQKEKRKVESDMNMYWIYTLCSFYFIYAKNKLSIA